MKALSSSAHLCACRDCQGTSHGVRPAWWPEGVAYSVDLWPNSFDVPVHEVIVSPLLCSDTTRRPVLTVMLELAQEGDNRQVGGGWEADLEWNHDEEIYQ